jgi:hypothetical protein
MSATDQGRIRVESGGTVTDRLPLVSAEIEREIGLMAQARVRTDETDLSVERTTDVIVVEAADGTDVFAGPLRDVDRQRDVAELVVDSFERRAKDAQRLTTAPAGVADTTIIQDAIDAVPELTAGTLAQQASGLSFVFERASPAKVMRTVADTTGGVLVYNPDKTVDYVSRRGADKSTTVTRDAAAGSATAVDQFRVLDRSGSETGTHFTVLGASRGPAQREATVVPSDDGATYPNKTTYTNPDWSSGDPKVWRTVVNKDHTDIATLQEFGETVAADKSVQHRAVETRLLVDGVALGDSFPVTDSRYGIDDRYRVVQLRRIIEAGRDVYDCVLSSRERQRGQTGRQVRGDVERYNSAFEGDVVQITAGGDRKPVDSSTDYVLKFYYEDDIEYEQRVDLRIAGLPYRAFSSGAASSAPSHTHDVDVTHPAHSHTVNETVTSTDNAEFSAVTEQQDTIEFLDIDDLGWTADSRSFSPTSDTSSVFAHAQVKATGTDGGTMEARLKNTTTGNTYGPVTFNIAPASGNSGDTRVQGTSVLFQDPTNCNGETLQMEYRAASGAFQIGSFTYFSAIGQHTHDVSVNTTSSQELGTTTAETSASSAPPHTHAPDPGIEEFGNLLPLDVDASINGSSLGLALGNGTSEFEHIEDIRDELNVGAWNTITLSSDTLGHLVADVSGLVYIQDTGQ